MTKKYSFPDELLRASTDDRMAYYRDIVIVNHRKMREASEAVMLAINQRVEGTIVLLFGPAGSGKSTVLRQVEIDVIKAALPGLSPGCIPFLRMVAPSPDSGNYDWSDHYIRALTALSEVLIKHKVVFTDSEKKVTRVGNRYKDRKELRRIYEDTLQQRDVKVVGVDEAHSLMVISKGRKVFDQMECVKSLVTLTNAIHFLAGTYRLLGLRSLSGQVSRRSVNVHLGRYDCTIAEDLKEFRKVAFTLLQRMPLEEALDISGLTEYLYTYSCGCVGVLKVWMTRALHLALVEKCRKLLQRHLEDTALGLTELDRLATEIKEGEEKLKAKETPATLKRVQKKLGMEVEPDPNGEESSESDQILLPPPPASARKRIGDPAPQRFPVGAQ